MKQHSKKADSGNASEKVILTEIAQFADRPFECKNCSKEFLLTSSEVRFFAARGLNVPKRCKACRGKADDAPATPHSMQNKFFSEKDPTRVPMVPWRHI